MKEQTAVEWLVQEVNKDCHISAFIPPYLVNKAKEMEKEHIIEAYCNGNDNIGAEQYYNNTYKKEGV